MLRKLTVLALMACVLFVGAVRIRLVAQEAEERPETAGASRITRQAATEFARKLVGDDDLTRKAKEQLQSEAGALVLRDRAGHYEAVAREAGELVMGYYRGDYEVDLKDGKDPVTEADRVANSHIVSRLRDEFPDDAVVAEESSDEAQAA